jgi:hypothetical protein
MVPVPFHGVIEIGAFSARRHEEDFAAGTAPPVGTGACSLSARRIMVDGYPKALDTTEDR